MNSSILNIELTRLDEEWLKQPKLYYEAAEQLANKRFEMETLKNNLAAAEADLEDVQAKVDLAIRSNPSKYLGEIKVTEASIKNAVLLDPEYKKTKQICDNLNQELLKAKYEAELLAAIVEALNHKKSALENLVKLHSQNYFSVPKVEDPETSQEATQIILKKKATEKVKKVRMERANEY